VADRRDWRAGDLLGVDRHHDLVLLDLLLDDHHGALGKTYKVKIKLVQNLSNENTNNSNDTTDRKNSLGPFK